MMRRTLTIIRVTVLVAGVLTAVPAPTVRADANTEPKAVAIIWADQAPSGKLTLSNGEVTALTIAGGKGQAKEGRFRFESEGNCRLEAQIDDALLGKGSGATLVHVQTDRNPFSFFLRDVDANTPMFIPAYQVAVTETNDRRTYDEIAAAVLSRERRTGLQQIQDEPETSYENAAAHTRSTYVPTWLGLGRDIRLFEGRIGEPYQRDDIVAPKLAGSYVSLPELGNRPLQYSFTIGRGRGCRESVTRKLDGGILPILQGNVDEDDIQYHFTAFVTLEDSLLRPGNVRGTSYLVADGHAVGHMFTPEQQRQYDALKASELERHEETVLYCRIEAVNTGSVPRYAWFKAPSVARDSSVPAGFDGEVGFSTLSADQVYCVSRLDGKPSPQEELAALVRPRASVVYEFLLPHRPIPRARAAALARQDFTRRHEECRQFWRYKLRTATRLRLPEKRIEEMIQAGLLHLDLICFGLESEGTLAPMIGVYAPIGSESAPIIQFMDSMGWHDAAERALQYFLDKQHDDGMIQNFGGYMLETGAALWSMGEHSQGLARSRQVHRDKRRGFLFWPVLPADRFARSGADHHRARRLRPASPAWSGGASSAPSRRSGPSQSDRWSLPTGERIGTY